MPDAEEYPRQRPFFENPHHPVGRRLWTVSHARYAEVWGLLVAIGGLFFWGYLAIQVGGVPSLALIVVAFAWFVAFGVVSEFASEVLCPSCEYPQESYNHYCPACGAEVADV